MRQAPDRTQQGGCLSVHTSTCSTALLQSATGSPHFPVFFAKGQGWQHALAAALARAALKTCWFLWLWLQLVPLLMCSAILWQHYNHKMQVLSMAVFVHHLAFAIRLNTPTSKRPSLLLLHLCGCAAAAVCVCVCVSVYVPGPHSNALP